MKMEDLEMKMRDREGGNRLQENRYGIEMEERLTGNRWKPKRRRGGRGLVKKVKVD